MLEFRLLGPLEVRDGEKTLPVPRQKQRALLALLVIHAGQTVSKERLIDGIWGDEAPRMAKGALENYVSQLRKILGKNVLATRPAGYVLQVESDQVDVLRFERHVADARGAGAEDRILELREALALFRGPPLADLAYEPFADVEIRRLEELELGAREDLISAELELGRHADVISELEALIARHPYRERLRGQLMLALYRSGRQADALAAYQKARGALVDELGIEPGEELQELEQAILRQDAALRAPARLEPARAEPEPAPRAAPRRARKTVTVLCSELAGASILAERLDPELLRGRLDRFVSAVRGAAERYGAAVETTSGRSVTAIFGVPAAHEDDALRALRAAVELRDTLHELEDRAEARTGVSTGEVFVGGSPGGRIAAGATVELAEQLCRAAGPGEIRLAAETYELAKDAVSVDQQENAFRLVKLGPDAGGRPLRLDSPLVGRERQLAALHSALEGSIEEQACHLFTVLGDAGVGKSRLVRELVESLGATATVLQGRCLPYAQGITFWPLIDALQDRPEAETAAFVDLVTGEAPPEEIFAATRRLLETLAAEQPLVAVLDDLQWAEPTLLDLVEHVAERCRDRILIICLARPELLDVRPGWSGGLPRASSTSLEPLTEDESERLVDNLLGESDLPDPVRKYIIGSSAGNPLFVEELLGSLFDRDVLQHQGGRWTTTELPLLTVPASLRALIASRIDLLPDDERVVLELASIEGKRFHAEPVAALAPAELRDSVDERLAGLVRRELIQPRRGGEGSYSFRHQLVRDAAYESLPKEARAELHERYADWLEERPHTAEVEEILGYHRMQASRYREELGLEPV